MRLYEDEGFSLIELIIVVAIMAILLGVLAPQYVKYVEKARASADEDMADTFLTAGYMMCADEDYIYGLNEGDQIIFSSAGVTISPANTTISEGLDEFADGWTNSKVKSKTYKAQSYVVEFKSSVSGGAFMVEGGWQP